MQHHQSYSLWPLVILVLLATTTVYGAQDASLHISDDISINQTSWISWAWQQWTAVFKLILNLSSLPIRPFVWLAQELWRHLVLTPLTLLVQVLNYMYPVLLFCGAACLCGLIIGGCSGFAAEALSSAVINATWGKQPIDKNTNNDDDDDDDDDDTATTDSQEEEDNDQTWNDNDKMGDIDWRHTSSRHSSVSSLYRLSISSSDPYVLSRPSSFYDDKPDDWHGNEDPEEIASFLRQRRRFQQQQHPL
ncbi:hypothetical protein BC941DRAFT_429616 [Chlamydoabsidia padenii]|nr:hypothetical protein BC941DRAFT_429616 [Chlamydoabsidia padenii]